MIPSVDRVGRYFPLTLAFAGEDVPLLARLERDAAWYGEVERVALSALSEGFSLEAFDEAVNVISLPGGWGRAVYLPSDVIVHARWFDLPDLERIADRMPQLSAQIEPRVRHSMFWTDGSPRVAPSLWTGEGLPDEQTFADMLGGLA